MSEPKSEQRTVGHEAPRWRRSMWVSAPGCCAICDAPAAWTRNGDELCVSCCRAWDANRHEGA